MMQKWMEQMGSIQTNLIDWKPLLDVNVKYI